MESPSSAAWRRSTIGHQGVILVFGKTGQVARELAQIDGSARFLSRSEVDLSKPSSCFDAIMEIQPAAVINAAAYTAVDTAESEESIATTINGEAPGAMSVACRRLGVPLVHVSTDYVFNGCGDRPFLPDDGTGPLGAYGRSKLAGEVAIREGGAVHVILRTSWVFSSYGNNFVKTMLRLAETRDQISVVADQVGGPTSAGSIASACVAMAMGLQQDTSTSGTYHFSGAPDVSWAEFAREIFRCAAKPTVVKDIPSSAFPTPALRPSNSRMDCSKLNTFGLRRPDWKRDLIKVISELEKK